LDDESARSAMQRFFEHLLPGGRLVMPFMLLWKRGDPLETPWHQSGEKIRPSDGVVVRRWSYNRFDPETQLEHTEDRYEVIRDGEVVASEHHVQSPATREYSQQQALQLYEKAGFKQIVMYKGFTRIPASAEDWIFTIVGTK